jgi:hypothetical protein
MRSYKICTIVSVDSAFFAGVFAMVSPRYLCSKGAPEKCARLQANCYHVKHKAGARLRQYQYVTSRAALAQFASRQNLR